MVWVGEASLLWGEVELYFLLLWFGRRDSGEFYPDIRSCLKSWGKPPLSDIGQGLPDYQRKSGLTAFWLGKFYFAKCYFSKGNDIARHF